MRRDEQIRRLPQWTLRRQWLRLSHVQRRAPQCAVFERRDQCRFIQQRTARDIDQPRPAFHGSDFSRANQLFRFRRLRRANQHVIRAWQCFVKLCCGKNLLHVRLFALAGSRHSPNLHVKRFRPLRHFPADGAVPHNQQHFSIQLRQVLRLVPNFLLSPSRAVLSSHRVRKIPCQRQQQTHGMLRHRYGKNSARVRHQDSRIAQLRIHQLRHARRRRMNPLQFLRVLQLLSAQGVPHKNIRVRQRFRQVIIIRQMQHAHPWPPLANRLRHRRFWAPLCKRMPHANNQFCL